MHGRGSLKCRVVAVMACSPAVLMRLVASAYAVAEKAGSVVRKVLHSGDLGIIEKVWTVILKKLENPKR